MTKKIVKREAENESEQWFEDAMREAFIAGAKFSEYGNPLREVNKITASTYRTGFGRWFNLTRWAGPGGDE